MKAPASSVARLIRRARKSQGLSQHRVAQALKFSSPQFVSNIERGKAPIPFKQIPQWLRVLKLNKDELLSCLEADLRAKYQKYL